MSGSVSGQDDQNSAPFIVSRKWLVLALVIVMQAFTAGTFTYSFSFWVQPWMQEFSVERADVMTVITLRIYAVALASFFLGKLLDRYPQKIIATIGVLAYALSMATVGFSNSLLLIIISYTLPVALAIVMAGPLAAIVFVSQVFEKRRGLAIGLATLGTSLGGAIIPSVCAYMIETFGWRQAHFLLAGSSLFLLPLIWLILTHKPDRHVSSDDRKTNITNLSMLKNRNFWIVVLALTGAYTVFSAIQFNLVPLTSDIGIGLRQSALVVTTMTIAMLAGKVTVGYLADKLDQRLLFLCVTAAISIGLLVLIMLKAAVFVFISFALMGLGTGGLLPLKGTIMGAAFGPKKVGQAMGLAAPFMSIYAMGPIIAGKIRDETGTYQSVLIISLAVMVLLAPVILLLRIRSKPDEVPEQAAAQTVAVRP